MKIGFKIKRVCILFLAALLLCACGADELEDRCFPMLALVDYEGERGETSFCYTFPSPRREEDQMDDTKEVDTSFAYGETFVDAWHEYEDRLDKKADYNHLKVVVLGEAFVEDEGRLDEMLSFMEERHSFPRNAYVCVIPSCSAFMEIQGALSDDSGNYLESYLKNHDNAKKYEEVTLGKLMDEKENRQLRLMLPYIKVEDSNIVWADEYVMEDGVPIGRDSLNKMAGMGDTPPVAGIGRLVLGLEV